MKRVVVASAGLNPAIMQMLLGLQQHELLALFTTTLAFAEGSSLVAALPKLANRVVTGIEADKLRQWVWPELLRLLCAKLDRSGFLADRVWEWLDHRFAERSARQLGNADAVLGFEHSSLELFRQAQRRGVACLYNVPSAHSGLIKRLLKAETERWGELTTGDKRLNPAVEARRQARRDEEFTMADLVIAHSDFCKRSYAEAGFDAEKIRVISFGAPLVRVTARPDVAFTGTAPRKAPVFLFAGNFAAHKGAHILLAAWRHLAVPGARLLIAGDNFLPERWWRPHPAGVEVLGRLPWPQLQALYHDCTALVLPSLSDGFGMVVTEALANGLPVITTRNTGASDLIVDGGNGLLVPILDVEALASALQRVTDDAALVQAMRQQALATASRWQWADFRSAFAQCIAGFQPGTRG